LQQLLSELYEQSVKLLTAAFERITKTLKQQFESLPGVDYIKEKYTEILGDINPVETVKSVLLELMSALAEVVPEQAKPLFNKVSDYLKKVKYKFFESLFFNLI
jgi:hypothetical protein